MRSCQCTAAVLVAAAVAAGAAVQEPPEVRRPDGSRVAWQEVAGARSPGAVVVFASWSPRAQALLEELESLQEACADRGWQLTVVAVQEPLEVSREALAERGVIWVHDRHGALLKLYRVVRVPMLVILGDDAEAEAVVEPTPSAIRAWEAR